MTEYQKALFHAKACVKCIRKALVLAGSDPDEPPTTEGGYGEDPPLLPPDSVRSRYILH
jgi:hypothetical protein